MVTSGLSIKLFDFQEKAVIKLIDLTSKKDSKQTIIMKAPTGSGKTIILIDYVDTYLTNVSANTAFIWLCPGKGNLEEQSREKMMKFAPGRTTQNLFDALLNGFAPSSTTFINWELVTKRGNTAIRDSERKNLFDRIADAHRAGMEFIVIIDEEHSNNTAKAKTIIDAFASKNIVRVSATAIENKRYEFFEIDEVDVIGAGLITKALYVNEGVADNTEITDDYDYLLDLADAKRKAIAGRYREIGKNIRPLVLIQFPNGQPETLAAVEQKLESMGYTYDNGMVSKWMSEDKKDLPDNLTENDAIPVFLLMKQAISTGWDCPRAKILVKLREVIQELCCGAFPPLGIRPRQRQSALHQQYIIRKSPEDVSWQDLRDYIKWLQKERNLSERTVNAAISQLRFFTIYVLHKPWDDNQLPKRKFDEYVPFRFSLSYTRINSSGLLILHHIMLPDQHSDVVKHTGKNQ